MRKRNTPCPPWCLERTLPWAVAALAFLFLGFELTNVDLWVQDALFDFARGRWRVDGHDPLWRAVFYIWPKLLLIGFGLVTLVVTLGPAGWRARVRLADVPRRELGVLVLTLATTPALVGGAKAVTNVFCPSEIRRYGGDVCYVKVLERFSPVDRPAREGHCFPAGHASGGFALMALAGLARTRRGQWLGVAAGLIVGGAMGAYQMAKGAHYLSHTLVTALLAWIVFVCWSRCLRWRWSKLGRSRGTSVSAPAEEDVQVAGVRRAATECAAISTCGNNPASG